MPEAASLARGPTHAPPRGPGLPEERGPVPPPGSGNHVTPPGCSVLSANQRAGIACIPLGQWGAAVLRHRQRPRPASPLAAARAGSGQSQSPLPRNNLAPAASQP